MTDIYDFGGEHSQPCKKKCECGKVIEVSSQDDSEYQFDVYVKCDCGRSVHFVLPCN